MTWAIETEDLSVEIGRTAVLHDVSLCVRAGELLGVIGPSGSGKTTLLRAITGLTVPARGIVRIDGRITSSAGAIHVPLESRNIGMVFQDLALWPHLTVHQNLAFGLDARRVPKAERDEAIAALLEPLGLMDKQRCYPGQLSGGERQRVAIARALVLQPTAVLLDEPLSHLDVELRQEMLGVFWTLLRARNVTTLYVTHDLREVRTLADRVLVLERGAVVQGGTLEELRAAPADRFVRQVFDDLDGYELASYESTDRR
jgi:iron(III) transport system ATP-binding protein